MCVLGDYTEDDKSEQKSGIKEPLKFHLLFGYKKYVGICGLKTERGTRGRGGFVHRNFYFILYPV